MHVDILEAKFLGYDTFSLQASSPIWVSEWRSREGARLSRLLSRVSRASTFHNIPQMESSLAGCDTLNVPH